MRKPKKAATTLSGRWAVVSPVYNQEHFIRPWVLNAANYADIVIVMYSDHPWGYNPEARTLFSRDATGEILAELEKEVPNLMVVRGDWQSETEQRNESIALAKSLGCRYLLLADCDEFYTVEDAMRARRYIESHPGAVWKTYHVQLIKRATWAVRSAKGLPSGHFAIDLEKDVSFKHLRATTAPSVTYIPASVAVCYHFSYLMPMDKLRQKLLTFGHANELGKNWFETVWPKIRPGLRDFHPVWPDNWKYCYPVSLPREIVAYFEGTPGWRELGLFDETTLLDVCIVTYNSGPFIKACIDSLRSGLPDARIHIIDNDSSDETRRILAGMNDIVVTFNDHNELLSPVWNRFLRSSTSEFVLFLNPDAVLNNGEPLLNAAAEMKTDERFAAAGCVNTKATYAYLKTRIPPVRPEDLDVFVTLFENSNYYQSQRGDGKTDEEIYVPYVHGECILVHRERALSAGGFSEQLPLYFNDPEFCVRLRDHGFDILAAYDEQDGTLTHHWGGSSNTALQERMRRDLLRNRMREAVSRSRVWSIVHPYMMRLKPYRVVREFVAKRWI